MAAAWRGGVPLIVRTLTLRLALLLATYVAASISTPAVAAHQVAFTIWTFLAFASTRSPSPARPSPAGCSAPATRWPLGPPPGG